MNNLNFKEKLLEKLYEVTDWVKKVNSTELRTRCPYCGDSDNIKKGHFYIKINPNDNYKIVCHCFKCDEPNNGIMTEETLRLFGIEDKELIEGIKELNKNADKVDTKNLSSEYQLDVSNPNLYYDFKVPEVTLGYKTDYVSRRLGINFTKDDFNKMKVITSLKEFLRLNNIKEVPYNLSMIDKLDNYFIGFLSNNKTHIFFRDTRDKRSLSSFEQNFPSWLKYPITKKSKEAKAFYFMESSLDIFTNDTININVAEGVLDIVSICYNMTNYDSNSIYIAVTGKYYDQLLLYLLDLGIVGSNVILNIYADNDAVYNKKAKNPTTPEYYREKLNKIKYLYKEVNIYYNKIGKDFGVKRNEISLMKVKL